MFPALQTLHLSGNFNHSYRPPEPPPLPAGRAVNLNSKNNKMIAIITEKPSVGVEIARVVGAREKHNGYMEGNGYIVTWAFGHLVQLALPESYGRKRSGGNTSSTGTREPAAGRNPSAVGDNSGNAELPFIPDPFLLAVRRGGKPNKGGKSDKPNKAGKPAADSVASRQLTIIKRVLGRCEGVIAATDAGREGELIFRSIYNYLGCTLPVQRLWISSLTEEAIEKGFRDLRDGSDYYRLYLAADCRAKADWLVGINASNALARVSGISGSSLGRVQTPTLAMIASRYLKHRHFLPSDYWSLSVVLGKGDALRKLPTSRDASSSVDGDDRHSVDEAPIFNARFRYVEDIKDEATAEAISERLKSSPEAKIVKVERNRTQEAQPLLYDLTTLQKECNTLYDMPSEKTLEATQSLYEKKLISYPRTGSRYIPPDILPQIPSLLRMILRMEPFAHLNGSIDPLRTSRRSVDASRVTDHHALIITGNYARESLTANEQLVYDLICGRMLEAFGSRCEKETLLIEATIGDMLFRSRSTEIISAGWRGVYNRPEERSEDEDDIGAAYVEFAEGETLTVMGHSLAKRKTQPKPLYTEATLLTAMEIAGKQVTDEKAREALMESGLGTPATRAAIIEKLLSHDYIERSGKSLIPTERGLALYEAVRNLRIADVELTASWEKSLAAIERGDMPSESFMQAITIYTRQTTEEVLSLDMKRQPGELISCPKCGNGRMVIRHRLAKCNDDKCGLVVYRRFLNKTLTEEQMRQLLRSSKTGLIEGFQGKSGKTFDAHITFDGNFNLTFEFSDNGKKRSSGDEAKADSKPRSTVEPKSKPKCGAGSGKKAQSESKSGAKPKSCSKPKPKAGTTPEYRPKPKAEVGYENESNSKPKSV